MFCRTKKVKEMIDELIDELKDEIRKLRAEIVEAEKEPMMPYGEDVVPVLFPYSSYMIMVQDKMPVNDVLEKILAHLGMEIVKEAETPAQILLKKKTKPKKPTKRKT